MKSTTLMMSVVFLATFAAEAQNQAATPPTAPQQVPEPPAYGTPISLAQAQAVIARVEEEARKRKAALSFAVVEPSGRLVAFGKMDGANYSSIESAIKKATSAAVWRRSTNVFADGLAQNNTVILQLPDAYGSRGGEPILIDGKIVGALGVSGGPIEGELAKLAVGTVK